MPDSMRVDSSPFGKYGPAGIYGSKPGSHQAAPAESAGQHDRNVVVATQTNMRVAFGLEERIQRNIRRTRGVFRMNISPVARHHLTPSGSGMKTVQALPDPSVQAYMHLNTHPERKRWAQEPKTVVQANRVSQNISHTARIRAAAPAQVNWKVQYVQGQRQIQPQGPYHTEVQKSILYRLSDYLSSLGGG